MYSGLRENHPHRWEEKQMVYENVQKQKGIILAMLQPLRLGVVLISSQEQVSNLAYQLHNLSQMHC